MLHYYAVAMAERLTRHSCGLDLCYVTLSRVVVVNVVRLFLITSSGTSLPQNSDRTTAAFHPVFL